MKRTAFVLALTASAALGLAGCAEVEKAEDFLTNPKTVQAVATLKAGASAFVCSVADAAAVAQQVEAAIQAGQSVQGTDGKLYVSSAIVCSSLGGTVTGTGVVQ
jgi:predicted nicotinamide N-methyase